MESVTRGGKCGRTGGTLATYGVYSAPAPTVRMFACRIVDETPVRSRGLIVVVDETPQPCERTVTVAGLVQGDPPLVLHPRRQKRANRISTRRSTDSLDIENPLSWRPRRNS